MKCMNDYLLINFISKAILKKKILGNSRFAGLSIISVDVPFINKNNHVNILAFQVIQKFIAKISHSRK